MDRVLIGFLITMFLFAIFIQYKSVFKNKVKVKRTFSYGSFLFLSFLMIMDYISALHIVGLVVPISLFLTILGIRYCNKYITSFVLFFLAFLYLLILTNNSSVISFLVDASDPIGVVAYTIGICFGIKAGLNFNENEQISAKVPLYQSIMMFIVAGLFIALPSVIINKTEHLSSTKIEQVNHSLKKENL